MTTPTPTLTASHGGEAFEAEAWGALFIDHYLTLFERAPPTRDEVVESIVAGRLDARMAYFKAGFLAALSPVQPAGWRLVPEEPTDHQVMSARLPYEDLCLKSQMESVNWKDAFRVIYRAMISAAPAASTSTTEETK